MQDKTLLLNPGSCGPRRFHQAITMATAEISDGNISVTRIDIPQKPITALTKSGTADLKKQIEIVMRETQKNRSPEKIADKYQAKKDAAYETYDAPSAAPSEEDVVIEG